MVRALELEQENFMSRLFNFRGTNENAGRRAKTLSMDSASRLEEVRSNSPNDKPSGSVVNIRPDSVNKDDIIASYQAKEKQLLQGWFFEF